MKKRTITILVVVLIGYIIGVFIAGYVEGTKNIGKLLTSLYALAGAVCGGTAMLVYYMGKPLKKKDSDAGIGKTKSGEKMAQYYDAKWVSTKELQTDKRYNFQTWATLPSVKDSGIVIRNEVVKNKLEVNMYKPIHTLVIGTTGSGKTTFIIDPAIRILSHTAQKPCLVITDPKGELYINHSKQLRKEGYRIMSIDLRNPFASTRWNPMQNAYEQYHRAKNIESEVKIHNGGKPSAFHLKETPDFKGQSTWYEYNGMAYGEKGQLVNDLKAKKQELIDAAENELREIATNVVPITNKNESSWERGAQDLLYGIMLAMLEDSEKPELGMTIDKFNFYNLAKIATTRDEDPDNPYGTLRDYCGSRGTFSKVASLTSTAINNAPGTTKSYMGILYSAIAIFQDMGICYATSKSDMTFDTFVDKPTVLFIKVPDEKESRHCIATMCISQIYKKLIEIASHRTELKLPRPVYFLLDEFANLPKIEKMDSIITVARSRQIFFELVVQSYSQLDNKYGKEVADTIRGNCNIQIYLGTDDQKTKEDFSKMCGEVSLEMSNVSKSKSEKKEQGSSTTTSTQLVTRPLIGPYELGQLPFGTAIVKIFQSDPIKTKLTQYFQVKEFALDPVADEYVPAMPFDEQAIFYDIKKRNSLVYKNKPAPFDPFSF